MDYKVKLGHKDMETLWITQMYEHFATMIKDCTPTTICRSPLRLFHLCVLIKQLGLPWYIVHTVSSLVKYVE